MKENEFKAEIVRNNYTLEKLANELGMSRSSLSRKIGGMTQFTLPELRKLKIILHLSGEAMISIFFEEEVSYKTH